MSSLAAAATSVKKFIDQHDRIVLSDAGRAGAVKAAMLAVDAACRAVFGAAALDDPGARESIRAALLASVDAAATVGDCNRLLAMALPAQVLVAMRTIDTRLVAEFCDALRRGAEWARPASDADAQRLEALAVASGEELRRQKLAQLAALRCKAASLPKATPAPQEREAKPTPAAPRPSPVFLASVAVASPCDDAAVNLAPVFEGINSKFAEDPRTELRSPLSRHERETVRTCCSLYPEKVLAQIILDERARLRDKYDNSSKWWPADVPYSPKKLVLSYVSRLQNAAIRDAMRILAKDEFDQHFDACFGIVGDCTELEPAKTALRALLRDTVASVRARPVISDEDIDMLVNDAIGELARDAHSTVCWDDARCAAAFDVFKSALKFRRTQNEVEEVIYQVKHSFVPLSSGDEAESGRDEVESGRDEAAAVDDDAAAGLDDELANAVDDDAAGLDEELANAMGDDTAPVAFDADGRPLLVSVEQCMAIVDNRLQGRVLSAKERTDASRLMREIAIDSELIDTMRSRLLHARIEQVIRAANARPPDDNHLRTQLVEKGVKYFESLLAMHKAILNKRPKNKRNPDAMPRTLQRADSQYIRGQIAMVEQALLAERVQHDTVIHGVKERAFFLFSEFLSRSGSIPFCNPKRDAPITGECFDAVRTAGVALFAFKHFVVPEKITLKNKGCLYTMRLILGEVAQRPRKNETPRHLSEEKFMGDVFQKVDSVLKSLIAGDKLEIWITPKKARTASSGNKRRKSGGYETGADAGDEGAGRPCYDSSSDDADAFTRQSGKKARRV